MCSQKLILSFQNKKKNGIEILTTKPSQIIGLIVVRLELADLQSSIYMAYSC